MSDIQKKLDNYLNGVDVNEYYPEQDAEMMVRMLDFIMDLNTDSMSNEQIEEAVDIIDTLADENINEALEDEDMDEAFSAKKVKIKPSDKRKRKIAYRRNRASLKLKAKKWRRTTKYKQWKRKKERRSGQGKTATGKRIRKFL